MNDAIDKPCKWLSDDFSGICCNVDCDNLADFCPYENRKVCAEYEGEEQE